MATASALELDQLTETGIKLGYKDAELRKFVNEERVRLKQERDAEREARMLEREENEKQRKENEKQRVEKQVQRVESEKQRVESEKQREFLERQFKLEQQAEKEKYERSVSLEKLKKESNEISASAAVNKSRAKPPKLPVFCEGKDELDFYLQRFERYATVQKWDKKEWAINLSSLLTGKALTVYSTIPTEDAHNYETLKTAILKAYHLTQDGYRQKFKTSRPEGSETATQYLDRITDYLQKWLNLAHVPKTYEGIVDFLAIDQFLQSLPKDMALFVKERYPHGTKAQVTDTSERYLEAHKGWSQLPRTQNRPPISTRSKGQVSFLSKSSGHSVNRQASSENRSESSSKFTGKSGKPTCHFCHQPGHFWRNCKNAPKSFVPAMSMIFDIVRDETLTVDDNTDIPNCDNPEQDTYQSQKCDSQEEPNSSCESCELNSTDEVIEASFMKMNITNDHHIDCALKEGHFELKCGHRIPLMSAACTCKSTVGRMITADGYVGNQRVDVMRDSGCDGIVVKSDLVPKEALTGKFVSCTMIDGTVRRFPIAMIEINTPFISGSVPAVCMKTPVYKLIIGSVPGATLEPDPSWNFKPMVTVSDEKTSNVNIRAEVISNHTKPLVQSVTKPCQVNSAKPEGIAAAVETRSQAKAKAKLFKPLKVSQPLADVVTVDKLCEEQMTDVTLQKIRDKVSDQNEKTRKSGGSFKFVKRNGVLFREFQAPNVDHGNVLHQVVVPFKFRKHVMHLAHESILGGHQGVKKTIDKITTNFFWPGIQADVRRYCQSCDICQRTIQKGRVTKVPLGTTPLIDTPFDRVAIDLVGPITPRSERGYRYILVVVDYATRYPEATPMKSVESERVAEELVNIYARLGFPKEVLSDQGPQFTADVMKEVSRLLSIRQLTSTPYNPKCNGLVERFNGTIKQMLKRMTEERPKDWDRYLGPLLFAYRETPQESTGFAPFELLFGRTVRGPMTILKELWTNETTQSETKNTYQYVLDLRDRLEKTCELAQNELAKSQDRYRKYYDRKTKPRQYQVGDEVLLLLPSDANKLLMQWKGPYPIVAKKSNMDYTIDFGNRQKTFHINMLKKYVRRSDYFQDEKDMHVDGKITAGLKIHTPEMFQITCTSVIEDEPEPYEMGSSELDRELIQLPTVKSKENFRDVHINSDLTKDQHSQIKRLVYSYSDILTDLPGRTNLGKHEVKLIDDKPVRQRPYPIPHSLRNKIQDEVDSMLKMGIVEHSDSPYASPLVIVKKPDGSDRYCVDFRRINAKTIFDAEPISDQSEIFAKLAKDRYFTKIDLSKGYWQIPMDEGAKPLTAFITHHGLFQWRTMPFGMVNAGASFSRIMRKLLKGLPNVDNYIDDILIHTPTFDEHFQSLKEVLKRLRMANLTARPSKCFVAYFEVEFLGHVVGKGQVKPRPAKIEAVQNAARPETKSQMRSYLGLTGYYRSYIPNYAMIAAPLTDKTKKGEPNKVRWESSQEIAFQTLKNKLVSSPILQLPDLSKPFILRTDASDIGIAAVLMQETLGEKFPVAYASKKLSQAQRNYSVMERECLAIVWAVQKFEPYLYGTQFTIETDHMPLKCVQRSKVVNGRIMRWALALQPYRYRIEVIKGSHNVGADFLSRAIEV